MTLSPAADPVPVAAGLLYEQHVPLCWRGLRYTARVVRSDPPEHAPAPSPPGDTGTPAVTEPLLLLGGALQDMYSWPRLERRIAPCTPIVLVDLPGTGTADDLAPDQGFDLLTEATLHVLDRLAIARVNVLGTSYGAPIAYRIAQRHPDRVARLLLAGTTRRVSAPVRALLREVADHLEAVVRGGGPAAGDAGTGADRRENAERLVDVLINKGARERVEQSDAARRLLCRQFLRTSPAETLRNAACHRRLLDADLIPGGGIRGVPALVFTGEHDITTTPDDNRSVAATIEGAAFVLLRHADHMAHLERDREYAELVLRFLRDLPLDGLPFCTDPEYLPRPSARRAG